MDKKAEKVSVRIIYNSGQIVDVKVDSLTVTSSGGLKKVNWAGMQPKPLFLGIDNIESIWEI